MRLALLLILLACLSFSVGVYAGQTQNTSLRSRIETDPKTGALIFIVNGREEARINADGLHVRHDIEYGHTITDVGEANATDANQEAHHAP